MVSVQFNGSVCIFWIEEFGILDAITILCFYFYFLNLNFYSLLKYPSGDPNPESINSEQSLAKEPSLKPLPWLCWPIKIIG